MHFASTKRHALAASVALIGGLGAALPAHAATATANLNVQAQVNASCTISTTVVDFGSYDPVGANASTAKTNSGGSVTIACTKGSAPSIGLGLGANASGAVRRMSNGTDFLSYELYMPPNTTPNSPCGALTTVWGTTGANLFVPSVPPSSASRTYNVCGAIPAAQDVGVGAYTDVVVATVNF